MLLGVVQLLDHLLVQLAFLLDGHEGFADFVPIGLHLYLFLVYFLVERSIVLPEPIEFQGQTRNLILNRQESTYDL